MPPPKAPQPKKQPAALEPFSGSDGSPNVEPETVAPFPEKKPPPEPRHPPSQPAPLAMKVEPVTCASPSEATVAKGPISTPTAKPPPTQRQFAEPSTPDARTRLANGAGSDDALAPSVSSLSPPALLPVKVELVTIASSAKKPPPES